MICGQKVQIPAIVVSCKSIIQFMIASCFLTFLRNIMYLFQVQSISFFLWYGNFCAAQKEKNNKVSCPVQIVLGVIQQLRGQNFAIFWPPSPLRRQFLYPERWQKQTFFDPLILST